jgi:hypothetical protein
MTESCSAVMSILSAGLNLGNSLTLLSFSSYISFLNSSSGSISLLLIVYFYIECKILFC